MSIEEYAFGRIKVNGKEYTADLVIYPDRIDSSWWRKEGHRLDLEDLAELLQDPPAILVIGTGYFGRMTVPAQTVEGLKSKGIRLFAAPTKEAVKEFNRLREQDVRTVAALHLTC